MLKKVIMIAGILLICLIAGCGKKYEPDPNDAMTSFIEQWEKQDFNQMYKNLTEDSKEDYSYDSFIKRNEKIYKDLEISKVSISSSTLSKKEIKTAIEEKQATIKLDIKLPTVAGDVTFNLNADLKLHDAGDASSWNIDWDEGFILPGLEDGGKVLIKKEQPRRGEILDRNKMPLALNDTAFEIGIVPNNFENESAEIQQIASILEMSADKINDLLNASWVQPDYFVPVKIIPLSAESALEQLQYIPSVSTKETIGRTYPLGKAAAHLTGYIAPITDEELQQYPKGLYEENDLIGKRGLEQMYEEQLHGEEGIKIVLATEDESGTREHEVIAEKPVKNGEHLKLSIDVNIQEKIYQSYEDKSGTAAAIQPKTGEVLALVSSPAFNPNELTYGVTQNRWDQLMEDNEMPFVNRFSSTFAPGSSLKPITAAIGLSNGTINSDEGITINGLTWGKKEWDENVKITRVSTSDKPVDLKDALKRSDNIYFAMKALDMGSDQFIDGMKSFAFEEKIPIPFPIQSSQISNDGKLDEILLANTSYGQGEIEMSPLHIAFGYTPFLNDGNMIKPSFLESDKKGEVWKSDILSENDADKMKEYLRAVVAEGVAGSANDKDLAVSGKTGTAELKLTKDSKGHENGWFVGYPTEDQDIIIAMMIEKVENIGASSYVAEKVKDILKDIKK